MGAALGLCLFYLGVLALNARAHRSLQTAGVVAARMLLLLFAPAARNAFALLNCTTAHVSAASCSSFNGCTGSGWGSTGRGGGSTVKVSLMTSNPYYICWAPGAAHIAAGGLAAATLVFVVVVFPSATLWALWRLRPGCIHKKAEGVTGGRSNGDAEKAPPSSVLINPMRRKHTTLSYTGSVSHPQEAFHGYLLAPFLLEYRHNSWYTRHIDLVLIVLLAALQVV